MSIQKMSRRDERVFSKIDAKLGKLVSKQIQSAIQNGSDPGGAFASMVTALTSATAKTMISSAVSFGRDDESTHEVARKTADKLVEMVDELLKSNAVKMTRQLRDSVMGGRLEQFKPRRFGGFNAEPAEDNVIHMNLVDPDDIPNDPDAIDGLDNVDAPDAPELTDPADEPAPTEEDDA